MVSSTANVLGCFAVIYTLSNPDILTASISKEGRVPVCITINNSSKYSLAVFEWKSDGTIGVNPVATAQYKPHNGGVFSTGVTRETDTVSGKNCDINDCTFPCLV